MTPAETLAAARYRVVGPYVPARVEWLEGWCGPANVREINDWFDGVVVGGGASAQLARVHRDERPGRGTPSTALYDIADNVRLDLTRPEVQDHLVRRGAPGWARELPPALWVWATSGKAPRFVLREWDDAWSPRVDRWTSAPVDGACLSTMNPEACLELENWSGWQMRIPANAPQSGPETGPEGRALADLAALSHGCILAVPDGWLLPLPDGGIGFWPREAK